MAVDTSINHESAVNALRSLNSITAMITDLHIYEYRVMSYYMGAWWTKFKIYAETDKEAIFDADNYVSEKGTQGYRTALCFGNRFVKRYQ